MDNCEDSSGVPNVTINCHYGDATCLETIPHSTLNSNPSSNATLGSICQPSDTCTIATPNGSTVDLSCLAPSDCTCDPNTNPNCGCPNYPTNTTCSATSDCPRTCQCINSCECANVTGDPNQCCSNGQCVACDTIEGVSPCDPNSDGFTIGATNNSNSNGNNNASTNSSVDPTAHYLVDSDGNFISADDNTVLSVVNTSKSDPIPSFVWWIIGGVVALIVVLLVVTSIGGRRGQYGYPPPPPYGGYPGYPPR
jgi:hypothetical protein